MMPMSGGSLLTSNQPSRPYFEVGFEVKVRSADVEVTLSQTYQPPQPTVGLDVIRGSMSDSQFHLAPAVLNGCLTLDWML